VESHNRLKITDKKFHENCFICGQNSRKGLKLNFVLKEDQTLLGQFKISEDFQGYNGILHGGIITAILDAGMINLFYMRDGIDLKTAKLNIRFIRPIPAEETITIRAVADSDSRHFYKAKSQIILSDKIFAEAEGYFRK
jgi:acyl-coenzyme A thioesterase PaaI-like protein